MALAGFAFHPDAEYQDRVECLACGLNVGAWEQDDEPMYLSIPIMFLMSYMYLRRRTYVFTRVPYMYFKQSV